MGERGAVKVWTLVQVKSILVFLVITYVFSSLFIFIGAQYKTDNLQALFQGIAALGPALACIITRKFITKEDFRNLGLSFGKIGWYFFALGAITLIFFISFGLARLVNEYPVFTPKHFDNLVLGKVDTSIYFPVFVLMVNPILYFPFLLGEELGWRGHLLDKLNHHGFIKSSLFIGIFWWIWHFPHIFTDQFFFLEGVIGIVYALPLFIVQSLFIGYIRIRSNSVLVAAFVHSVVTSQAITFWKYHTLELPFGYLGASRVREIYNDYGKSFVLLFSITMFLFFLVFYFVDKTKMMHRRE